MKKLKSIRIDEDLITAINTLAEKERRTFSNQVECLLEDALKKPVKLPVKINKIVSGSLDDETSIINYLNIVAGSNYQHVESNKKLIRARLEEGRTPQEIKSVVDRQNREWPHGDPQRKYLRPATLFNAEKFNQYFGQIGQPLTSEQGNGQRKSAYQQRVEDGDERSFNINPNF